MTRAYLSYFRIRMATGLQYRAAAWAGIATQFFFGFVFIMIYEAFYSSGIAPDGMSFQQLVNYMWLQQAFLAFVMLWYRDTELFGMITNGDVAYELARPLNIYFFWYVKLLAQRVSSAALRFSPIIIIAFLLPQPYRMTLPPTPASGALFLAALFGGLLLVVAISMLVYILTFITLSPTGSMYMFVIIGDFCAGLVLPLPMMPEALRSVISWLPFRFMADFPFRVYSGSIPPSEAALGLLLQVLWIAALVSLGYATMHKNLRRVVVQGG